MTDHFGVTETVTMLYYEDLEAPRHFYGEVLGLAIRYEMEWVTLLQWTVGSLVGLVRGGENAFHPVRPDNSVMLSIVCRDVDAWYRKVRTCDRIRFEKDIHDSPTTPIRAFLIRDPGNYAIEFFQWREEPV